MYLFKCVKSFKRPGHFIKLLLFILCFIPPPHLSLSLSLSFSLSLYRLLSFFLLFNIYNYMVFDLVWFGLVSLSKI